mgnify:CR=1 FL=1
MEKIIGFHATDKALADSIIANGFSFSRSEEHWLGNGVYFFADPDLAVWWSGNPTNKFGVHIITPCVLKTTIESDAICDMRELKYYNLVTALYIQFYHNTGIRLDSSGISKTQYFNRIRCAFFDWLHSHSNIEVVIAPFSNPHGSFLTYGSLPEEFHIPFVHAQICVFNTRCIKQTVIFKEDTDNDTHQPRHRFR